ncbi:MAG: hypothetical protein JWM42_3429 [Burkholderia sp.]|nr:hypothetical protein [Burkholderia sp.]
MPDAPIVARRLYTIRGAFECNFTCDSVRRVISLASVSGATLGKPCSASSCILYNEVFIVRANSPSIIRLPPMTPPSRSRLPVDIHETRRYMKA